ncbi:MAG TPA: Npt1/Npt2 family nucleotide transporter [Myxococcota bacterium]|nr:Npt1/Npt2 family nucleotide transporter [Myxococcota bacterium]HRY96461.1 Npt1/Npt2 family nucleotide transporter [Myxococcota bacterium]
MPERIASLFGIQRGEGGRTAGMFLYLMLAVGAFITGRVCRDALFLSRYDVSYLPYMYVWVAGAMSLLSYTYSRFADRLPRERLVLGVTGLLLLGVLASRLLLVLAGDWFAAVLYVYVEVMGGLLLIQAWTFANDVFDTRQAKRLFGLVGAGGVVASIALGSAIGTLSQALGTANLLFLCAGLLLGCMGTITYLSRACRRELALAASGQSRQAISLAGDWGRVFSSRHLKVIAWITVLCYLAVTLVDYQFKILARLGHLNREDQLSSFLGWFYAITGLLSLGLQVLVTGRLLQRFGVIAGLLLLPLSLLAGSFGLLLVPGLLAAAAVRGSDQVLRYTVHDATHQILYLPVPGRLRGRAKAFIDGILKPLAQGLGGLLIAWLGPLFGHRVQWLGVGVVLLCLGWVGLLLGLKREYLSSLVATLRQRRIHFGESTFAISDSQTVAALEQTLADEDEHNVLHALEMLPFVRNRDWSSELGRLLQHGSSQVRVQALRQVGADGATAHLGGALKLLGDTDEGVRAEAVRVVCVAIKDRAMGAVEPLLLDDSVQVRASAVVGLMRYGGLDGIVLAAETLKALLGSAEPSHRQAGAWAVGKVEVRSFFRSLMPLLADPVLDVRLEAVRAAGLLRSPELVLPLIHRLEDPKTRRAATLALAAHGPGLTPTLRTLLTNPRESVELRRAVPQVLARVGDQLAMDVLAGSLDAEDDCLRARLLEAMVHLHQREPRLRRDLAMLRRALHRELKLAYQLLTTAAELEELQAPLLQEGLERRQSECIERIFKLLRLLHPGRSLEAVHRNLANPVTSVRANALEVLEATAEPETRRCLLPLLEARDRRALRGLGDQLFPILHRSPLGWLQELLAGQDAWLMACTLDVARRRRETALEPMARALLRHSSPLVRESAAFCLERLQPAEGTARALASLCDDPHPRVQLAVRFLCALPAAE